MILRKTEKKDVDKVVEILEKAKIELKKLSINQWQDGYPNKDSIIEDIKNNCSYVLEKSGEIVATTAITIEKEGAYENIKEGKWITNDDYVAIHRIAVDSSLRNQGISTELLKLVEKEVKNKRIISIRIDTHEDNRPMRRLLEKANFTYCGVIYLDRGPNLGDKRLAFEKVLK